MFPPMVVQMMAVGEETGALDEMLDKIADFYDQEVEATVNALTSLIEPILIVVMGVVHRRHDHRPVPADVRRHQPHQVAVTGSSRSARRQAATASSRRLRRRLRVRAGRPWSTPYNAIDQLVKDFFAGADTST